MPRQSDIKVSSQPFAKRAATLRAKLAAAEGRGLALERQLRLRIDRTKAQTALNAIRKKNI